MKCTMFDDVCNIMKNIHQDDVDENKVIEKKKKNKAVALRKQLNTEHSHYRIINSSTLVTR